jgi:hypothetical protein
VQLCRQNGKSDVLIIQPARGAECTARIGTPKTICVHFQFGGMVRQELNYGILSPDDVRQTGMFADSPSLAIPYYWKARCLGHAM